MEPAYTIRADSGCTLAVKAIMAVIRMLPDRIQHVYLDPLGQSVEEEEERRKKEKKKRINC